MNNEFLNQIAQILNTTDKNTVITYAIKSVISQGISVKAAYEFVMGAGSWEKLKGETWEGFAIK